MVLSILAGVRFIGDCNVHIHFRANPSINDAVAICACSFFIMHSRVSSFLIIAFTRDRWFAPTRLFARPNAPDVIPFKIQIIQEAILHESKSFRYE